MIELFFSDNFIFIIENRMSAWRTTSVPKQTSLKSTTTCPSTRMPLGLEEKTFQTSIFVSKRRFLFDFRFYLFQNRVFRTRSWSIMMMLFRKPRVHFARSSSSGRRDICYVTKPLLIFRRKIRGGFILRVQLSRRGSDLLVRSVTDFRRHLIVLTFQRIQYLPSYSQFNSEIITENHKNH